MQFKKQEQIEIPITKPFLPPASEFKELVEQVWERNWLTNNGPLIRQLEEELHEYLELGPYELVFVTNGTIALQIAIKAFELKGEIITTPFSYVATTSSIVWEGCAPRFVDIDPNTFNINPTKIEEAINENTSAILATHVFGIPCDTDRIGQIAEKHNLKVIYDAAHAFGTRYKNKSLYSFGDVSTGSFHATKLYHSVEGGALITNNKEKAERFRYMRNFGHDGPLEYNGLGINGKNSEFHAAMGLVNLRYADKILEQRKKLCHEYDSRLENLNLYRPAFNNAEVYNYSYYPVVFPSEDALMRALTEFEQDHIQCRRYFFPGLHTLDYTDSYSDEALPETGVISRRILCLPLYHQMREDEIDRICTILHNVLGS